MVESDADQVNRILPPTLPSLAPQPTATVAVPQSATPSPPPLGAAVAIGCHRRRAAGCHRAASFSRSLAAQLNAYTQFYFYYTAPHAVKKDEGHL